MTSVITGDIIKSSSFNNPEVWLKPLKKALTKTGIPKKYWEIFRGDSFQIEVENAYDSFIIAVYLKACIKMTKGLDVRLAIGIGSKDIGGEKVTEFNGKAFQFSGTTLELSKKEKTNLMIKTNDSDLDKELNLYFKLALIAMDTWSINSAEITKLFYEYPEKTQGEIAQKININQDAVSKRIKRAHLEKIFELDLMYRLKLNTLLA